MSLDRTEIRRKAVHMGSGLFALALARLTWQEAALAALAALGFNLFVLPRVGGGALLRARDIERGFPIGILFYPVMVLVLILLFRDRLSLAAAGWGFLAFGDGFAALVGMTWGRTKLPWNRGKSWAGLAGYVFLGGGGAACLFGFVEGRVPSIPELAAVLTAAAFGAVAESLPTELDDNTVPPVLGACVLWALLPVVHRAAPLLTADWLRRAGIGIALNLAVAALAGVVRVVRPSGVVAGFVAGSLIYAFGGPKPYALLWIFFVLGTVTTRFGRKRKEAMGKAEEAGGRRGAANVLANVSVAAFCVIVAGAGGDARFQLAAAAALATALMDTVGTEVGQAIRTPTVLLPDFRRVPPGTDGAVSIAGTLAGLLAAAFLAAAALDLRLATPRGAVVILVAASAGTVVESLLGRAGAPWRVTNGHVLNFYNTLAGAAVAVALVAGAT